MPIAIASYDFSGTYNTGNSFWSTDADRTKLKDGVIIPNYVSGAGNSAVAFVGITDTDIWSIKADLGSIKLINKASLYGYDQGAAMEGGSSYEPPIITVYTSEDDITYTSKGIIDPYSGIATYTGSNFEEVILFALSFDLTNARYIRFDISAESSFFSDKNCSVLEIQIDNTSYGPMSGLPIYPTVPGLTWSLKKTPMFKTLVQEAVSGFEQRAMLQIYPRWIWELVYDFFRSSSAYNELQTLLGFFLQRQGAFAPFLIRDLEDNSVTGQAIGTGDGVTTAFQLARTYGGFTEPVTDTDGTATVYINGLPTTDYAISATGQIVFTTAPASGAVITADFSYYWRVRFMDDSSEFENWADHLWANGKIQLKSVKVI